MHSHVLLCGALGLLEILGNLQNIHGVSRNRAHVLLH